MLVNYILVVHIFEGGFDKPRNHLYMRKRRRWRWMRLELCIGCREEDESRGTWWAETVEKGTCR